VCVVAQPPTFKVRQALNTRDARGQQIQVRLLVDSRWTERAWKQLWGGSGADWSFALDERSDLAKSLASNAPLPAKVEVAYRDGAGVTALDLPQPLAEIQILEGGSFLVTTDESIGMGSYAGLKTNVLSVVQGSLESLHATDAATGKREPILLYRALKSDWRTETTKDGVVTGFLAARCDPDPQGHFTIHYIHYRRQGGAWVKSEKKRAGIWEADQSFPPRSAFP
jgi:hypothetical protein